jgi:hypothetical protein
MSFSQKRDRLGARAGIPYLRQDAHPLDDLQRWAEKIHSVTAPAEPQFCSALHDGWLVPTSIEPVGEHRAGNAGA